MEIKVKIYSCYKLTYTRIYKNILNKLYGEDINVNNVILEIDDISKDNKGQQRSIQSQRSLKKYVTRLIRIYEENKLVHIVACSNTNFDYDKKDEKEKDSSKKYKFGIDGYHANTYLKQGTPAIFNYYFEHNGVDLSFYLLDTKKTYPHNLFNILTYRELQTIGFNVLNIDEIDFKEYNEIGCLLVSNADISFSSFNKYMNDIALISQKNLGNNPSFLQCKEHLTHRGTQELYYIDKYIYTFKALSAQAYDSLFRLWCMKVLADEGNLDIEFKLGMQYYNYASPQKSISDKLPTTVLKVLSSAGINLHIETGNDFLNDRNIAENSYKKAKRNNDPRNQQLFRNNIRKKGIPTRCIVCGKDDVRILKAAHIWEVSSIKNSTEIEIDEFLKLNNLYDLVDQNNIHKSELFYKKYCLTNSGDNGIWLCANHHNQFDANYYSFDTEYGTIVLHFEDDRDANNFKKEMLKECSIPSHFLTKATKAFLAQRKLSF